MSEETAVFETAETITESVTETVAAVAPELSQEAPALAAPRLEWWNCQTNRWERSALPGYEVLTRPC